jgi:hypothetical protein
MEKQHPASEADDAPQDMVVRTTILGIVSEQGR